MHAVTNIMSVKQKYEKILKNNIIYIYQLSSRN